VQPRGVEREKLRNDDCGCSGCCFVGARYRSTTGTRSWMIKQSQVIESGKMHAAASHRRDILASRWRESSGRQAVNKTVPALFLLGAVLVIGFFFFRVVQPFILPLILACVLAVLFWPVQRRMIGFCRERERVAAVLITLLVVIAVLVPVAGGLTIAGMQLVATTEEIGQSLDLPPAVEESLDDSASGFPEGLEGLLARITGRNIEQVREMISSALAGAAQTIYDRTTQLLAGVFATVVAVVIMIVGVYYFLADHKQILGELQRLSPLDDADDRELWNKFVDVCRGILLGNVLAALLQAVLNGIGFAVLGVAGAGLLALLTFFLAFIPFVGGGAVWFCVALGLLLQGRYIAALFLVAYGALIVSSVDNLVRAHALHGRSQIHPLAALVAILGAIQLVGLWGIVIGPVTAAFFYALLNLLTGKFAPAPDHQQDREAGESPARLAILARQLNAE